MICCFCKRTSDETPILSAYSPEHKLRMPCCRSCAENPPDNVDDRVGSYLKLMSACHAVTDGDIKKLKKQEGRK